jgi:thioesterase domain-containing protein
VNQLAAEENLGPLIFLIPGTGGENPGFARFAGVVGESLRVVVLRLPDIDRPTKELGDLGSLVSALRSQVSRHLGSEPLHLAGYSLGGVLALELARELGLAGTRIGFLALLDSSTTLPTWSAPQIVDKSRDAASLAGRLKDKLVLALIGRGLFEPARVLILGLRAVLGSGRTDPLRIQFLVALGRLALARYRPSAYPHKVFLFRASRARPTLPEADLGWKEFCPQLRIVPVHGSHWSMFDEESVRDNAAAFAAELLLMERAGGIEPPTFSLGS